MSLFLSSSFCYLTRKEKQLKESKLVITEKEKKLKETGERDANIIQTLKKDLKERKLKMNEDFYLFY